MVKKIFIGTFVLLFIYSVILTAIYIDSKNRPDDIVQQQQEWNNREREYQETIKNLGYTVTGLKQQNKLLGESNRIIEAAAESQGQYLQENDTILRKYIETIKD